MRISSNGLKVKMESVIGDFAAAFYLYYEDGDRISVFKPFKMEIEQYKGESVQPTMRLNTADARALIKAFAELAENMGIKTDKQMESEGNVQGVMNATLYHLEDMRKLVFKEKK